MAKKNKVLSVEKRALARVTESENKAGGVFLFYLDRYSDLYSESYDRRNLS